MPDGTTPQSPRPPEDRDLMLAACGLSYEDAIKDAETVTIEGVPIPFASAETLWKMKQTYREKDEIDRVFLQRLLAERKKRPGC